MQKQFALALAGAVFVSNSVSAQFADAVVSYNPGVIANPDFALHPGVVLGAPSQINPFADLVEPFNPPYGSNQILSVGAGGSLTVQFNQPIRNDPGHPFGMDFNIFGNTGFIITNELNLETFEWVGTPATDGSLFGANSGVSRVWVSADGVNFYTLNPALAPLVDGLFPTDGAGDFSLPVNPGWNAAGFAGLDFAAIRARYQGSGGGTGFDIAWAQDGNGASVALGSISFVRVDVVSGKSDIDAFATVPEPAAGSLVMLGGTIVFVARGRLLARGSRV